MFEITRCARPLDASLRNIALLERPFCAQVKATTTIETGWFQRTVRSDDAKAALAALEKRQPALTHVNEGRNRHLALTEDVAVAARIPRGSNFRSRGEQYE